MSDGARNDPAHDADTKVLWGLFLLALAVRLLFLAISDNEDGDSFARIQLSRAVVDEGRWLPTDIWLPAHFWILSIPYALGLKGQLWARLLTAIAGAATVPCAFRLMARAFSGRAAFAGAALLALNPLHVRFSVVTVSETFLALFVVVGLWGFVEWTAGGRPRHLVTGALAMNLACGNRMEAWLVVLALFGASFIGRWAGGQAATVARGRGLAFSALSSVFACGWMIFSQARYGDALHIATLNTGRVQSDPVFQASMGWYTWAFWPAVLLASLGPVGFPTAIRGAFGAVRRGPAQYLGLLFFGFLGLYYVQNFRSAMITDARYALFLEILLVVSAGPALEKWGAPAWRWRGLGLAAAWLLAVFALGLVPFGMLPAKMRSISPCPRIKPEIRHANAWLKNQSMPAVIALGPDLGRYGPWYSLLDDWYPEDRVVVAKSQEAFVRAIETHPTGYVICRRGMPSKAHEWVRDLPSVTLSRVDSGAEYETYRWSRETGA